MQLIRNLFHKHSDDEQGSLYSSFRLAWLKINFNAPKRLRFYEQLGALLSADVALYDALLLMRNKLEQHKTLLKRYDVEIKVLNDLLHRMDLGLGSQSFGELFVGLIPHSELTVLSVDSRRGIEGLAQASTMIAQFGVLKAEIAKMMFTPLSSLLMIIILIFVINAYIFPMLLSIFTLEKLPAVTRSLYQFKHFFEQHLMAVILATVVTLCLIIYSLPNWTGFGRRFFDKLIPYSIYKQLQATSFLVSLSLLLDSEEDFTNAISRLKANASPYLLSFLVETQHQIGEGDRPGEALSATGLLNTDTKIYIEILDEAQVLSKGLSAMSERGIAMQIKAIKKIMSSISVILLAFVMGFSLWFYIGIGNIGFSANDALGQTQSINHQ